MAMNVKILILAVCLVGTFVVAASKSVDTFDLLKRLLDRGSESKRSELRPSFLDRYTRGEKVDVDKAEILNAHNDLRRGEGASNMKEMSWSDELADEAAKCASNCYWGHCSKKYGENILAWSAYRDDYATMVETMWFDEKNNYDFNSDSCTSVCGHYKAVVWDVTNKVGCSMYKCPTFTFKFSGDTYKDGIFMVCNYEPMGNGNRSPFKKGAPCSECDAGETCVDKLCSAGGSSAQNDGGSSEENGGDNGGGNDGGDSNEGGGGGENTAGNEGGGGGKNEENNAGGNANESGGGGGETELTVSGAQKLGDFGEFDMCEDGSFAVGFWTMVEAEASGDDVTALNAIDLQCRDPNKYQWRNGISSDRGWWGDWGQLNICPVDSYIYKFALKSEGDQGPDADDSTANDFKAFCRDIFTGETSEMASDNGASKGDWLAPSNECPADHYVCGISTMIQPHQHDGDDTALDDVKLRCCKLTISTPTRREHQRYELLIRELFP